MAIDLGQSGHIATITINRPKRLNALDAEHYHLLSQAWEIVRDDPEIRVAIVTGSGDRSFCAGADIKSFVALEHPAHEFWLTQRDQLLNRGLEVWKPVIAAVNGHCLGAGLTLLFATDIRFASPNATFGLPEIKRGVIASNGGTQRVLAQLPYAIAMEMAITGDPIDVETAAHWGLINHVVAQQDLLDAAYECAERVAANAPLAVQAAKELAIRSQDMSLADGLRLEQAFLRFLDRTDDVQEGKRAFTERQRPEFKGR
jgi:enoyl-CoA hydratase/carnithine racemase